MSHTPVPLPSLSLSDIMYPMSPPPPERPPVMEALEDHEIARMRARAIQMGLGTGTSEPTDATPRERELFDMVLRLTNPNVTAVDPAQLLRQAETISTLVQQRDYLLLQNEQERSRWQSEKDGWERMAEALIAQRARKLNVPDDSELKKMCQSLEFDNNSLKEKLEHTQRRINALEAELFKLKPHLLMQPFVPRPTPRMPQRPVPTPKHTGAGKPSENVAPPQQPTISEPASPLKDAAATNVSPPAEQPPTLHALAQASSYFSSLSYPSLQNVTVALIRKKKAAAQLKKALLPAVLATATTEVPGDTSAPPFPAPPPGTRSVFSIPQQPQKKPGRIKPRRTAPPPLITSDARAEHLLIAARRIGRERAGIVAGVISAERERMEREKAERERERIDGEKERIEREKRNRGGGGYYRERPEAGISAMATVVSPTPTTRDGERGGGSGEGSSRYANAMAGYVSAAGSPVKGDEKGKGKSVPTPLDSLLNAARSMMDEGGDENGADPPSASTSSAGGMMTRRRAANVNEPAEASVPKRRKLSGNTSHSPARVRTALDVLADQAAVFSNSDPPSKGKGKGLAEELAASVAPLVKRKRGRPPKDRSKLAAPAPAPAQSKASRLISPALVASSSQQGATDAESTRSASGSGMTLRPATRWVQRGRLAASSSSRAPPRQKDDIDSEDEDGDDEGDEPATETEKVAAESQGSPDDVDPILRPTAAVTPRPAVDETVPSGQDDAPNAAGTEVEAPTSQYPRPILLEDPVLDADADGESDPDVDIDEAVLPPKPTLVFAGSVD
ncbi:hypothetical protein B0H10DRAFT_2060146 [Mycena sp. CBHHK59/15]|nr:hypothetical protein B0H10DRAFT_2060146 [Mycena sp. CBHHK59/15]